MVITCNQVGDDVCNNSMYVKIQCVWQFNVGDNSMAITFHFNSTCHNTDSTSGTNTFLHFLDSLTNNPILSKSATSLQVHAPRWVWGPIPDSYKFHSFMLGKSHLYLHKHMQLTHHKTTSTTVQKQKIHTGFGR